MAGEADNGQRHRGDLPPGHGLNDNNDRYYFLPSDVNLDRLRRTGVLYEDITSTIVVIPCKTIAFLDTCHSGNVMGGDRRGASDMNGVINELASAENGSVVFCSATGRQFALENKVWGNGAFTKALCEALTGKAEGVDDATLRAILARDTLTVSLLNTYIAERVKQLTSGCQTPTMQRPATVPDFPIAIRK